MTAIQPSRNGQDNHDKGITQNRDKEKGSFVTRISLGEILESPFDGIEN